MYQLQNIQTLKFAGVHVARVASVVFMKQLFSFTYLRSEIVIY